MEKKNGVKLWFKKMRIVTQRGNQVRASLPGKPGELASVVLAQRRLLTFGVDPDKGHFHECLWEHCMILISVVLRR